MSGRHYRDGEDVSVGCGVVDREAWFTDSPPFSAVRYKLVAVGEDDRETVLFDLAVRGGGEFHQTDRDDFREMVGAGKPLFCNLWLSLTADIPDCWLDDVWAVRSGEGREFTPVTSPVNRPMSFLGE
jgi:hypothetical protein